MWTSFHPRRSSNWSLEENRDEHRGNESNKLQREETIASSSRIEESTSPIFRADDLHRSDDKTLLLRAKDTRLKSSKAHPSLWQLQIGQSKLERQTNDISVEELNGLSTTSSSPASSRRATLTERASSASPPSPFGVSHSDCSPPSTPPDTLSSGGSNVPFTSRRQWNLLGRVGIEKSDAKIDDQFDARQKTTAAETSTFIRTLPKSSSRNDIFSASSPSLQPAPRLPSLGSEKGGTTTPAAQKQDSIKRTNRQSGFFYGSPSNVSSPYPSPKRSSGQLPAETSSQMLNVDESDRPGYGRSNTEERERERERIRQTNMEIEFRLCPIKELMLGEGRHSNVYLGSYRVKEEVQNPSFDVDENEDHEWRLCAMKRPHADRQSQLLALEEAFALRRLGPHPNIIRLIKIRDEVQLSRPNSPRIDGKQETFESQGPDANQTSQAVLGLGLPSSILSPSSVRARATSDVVNALEKGLEKGKSQANAGVLHHRRMISQPENPSESIIQPRVRIVAPDTDESHSPQIDDRAGVLRQAETDTSRNDAPRLLMLLELLPFSLSSFSRRNPELVDYEQWRSWALELTGVVEWMHSRGCIHADLKPENILLTSDLHVKLCDFNSALFPNASTPLMDGIGLGTPAYGAPELSRTLNKSSDASKGFSYPVDIWSLGAILYTLATGTEPFRRARSMIDMVYRKRVFFESEENDRVARMSVAEGSSTAGPASYYGGTIAGNQGSLPASRKGSIRGRKSDGTSMGNTSTSTPLRSKAYGMHKRAPSTESVSSINSSMVVSSASGMRPSIQAIDILLDERTPTGLLTIPGSPQLALRNLAAVNSATSHDSKKYSSSNADTFATINGHHRASSMGKAQSHQFAGNTHSRGQQRWSSQGTEPSKTQYNVGSSLASPPSNTMVNFLSVRPDIRRTTSYNGQDTNASTSQVETKTQDRELVEDRLQRSNSRGSQKGFHEESSQASISPPSTISKKTGENAELRLAVAAAFARSTNYVPPTTSTTNSTSNSVKEFRKMGGDLSNFSLEDDDQSRNGFYFEQDLQEREKEDNRAYQDGTPALLLPGGGRLPDRARDLLERMLRTDSAQRPTASQVRAVLESL